MLAMRAFSALQRWRYRRWPSRSSIVIAPSLWDLMIAELGRRSLNGQRESGAFLLAARSGGERRVAKAVYYDDLDPDCLVGSIHFRATGYSKLWDICDEEELRVIADVHTHPGTWVTQSSVDRANPMIARAGHLALIVPDYGTRPVKAFEVGVHEYRGDQGWKLWLGARTEIILRVRST